MSDEPFGVGLFPTEPLPRMLNLVKLAEDAGFATAYVGDSQMIWREPYVMLGAAAMITKRITLATGVTNPITRDLGVIAAAWASLHEMVGDRLLLGIGAGGRRIVSRPLDVRSAVDGQQMTLLLAFHAQRRDASIGRAALRARQPKSRFDLSLVYHLDRQRSVTGLPQPRVGRPRIRRHRPGCQCHDHRNGREPSQTPSFFHCRHPCPLTLPESASPGLRSEANQGDILALDELNLADRLGVLLLLFLAFALVAGQQRFDVRAGRGRRARDARGGQGRP